MPKSQEHVNLRFQAVLIASQLPDDRAEALLVLDYARHTVVQFLDDSSVVSEAFPASRARQLTVQLSIESGRRRGG